MAASIERLRPKKAGDRKRHDDRGFMGRVESGEIAVGDEVRVLPSEQRTRVKGIEYRLDINTLQKIPAERLAINDIARVAFKLAQPLCVDAYA